MVAFFFSFGTFSEQVLKGQLFIHPYQIINMMQWNFITLMVLVFMSGYFVFAVLKLSGRHLPVHDKEDRRNIKLVLWLITLSGEAFSAEDFKEEHRVLVPSSFISRLSQCREDGRKTWSVPCLKTLSMGKTPQIWPFFAWGHGVQMLQS